MEKLCAKSRQKNVTNDAKRIRKEGFVPGILYGKNIKNILFEIGALELNKEVTNNGEHGTLNVEIDGQEHKTLIKEIQRNPVNQKILHIDLEEINDNTVIITEVPVIFAGEDMVIKKGGYVQKEKDSLKIRCKSHNIPKSVNIDLSKMQIGDTYKVSDVELSSEITIIEDLQGVIVAVNKNNNSEEETLETEQTEEK